MIEEDLVTALQPIFNGRFYPDFAPLKPTPAAPYGIYIISGGQDVSTFCGQTTPANYTIQFWVWAKTRNEANTLIRQLGSVVTAAPFYAVAQSGFFSQYDDETKLRGAFQDFSFWR